jgi:hypothetical protein
VGLYEAFRLGLAIREEEAQERAAEDIANEVLAALDGKTLRWRVA